MVGEDDRPVPARRRVDRVAVGELAGDDRPREQASRRPWRIATVSSTDGSSTSTGEKRRASAPSRSTFLNSLSVVAPTIRSSPRASIGLSMFAASIAP